MCGTNQWQVVGYTAVSTTTTPGYFSLQGPALPSAAVVCLNCGNTVFVNLFIAGVVSNG